MPGARVQSEISNAKVRLDILDAKLHSDRKYVRRRESILKEEKKISESREYFGPLYPYIMPSFRVYGTSLPIL